MWQRYDYDEFRIIDADRFRHRERDLSHARAVRDHARREGIVSRVVTLVASAGRRLASTPAIVTDPHDLTDYVCRLADGSMGRVSIRLEGEEYVAVCVPA